MYALPAYALLAQDFTTQAALYTHHQYIAGFINGWCVCARCNFLCS